jgi:protein ImuA
MPAALSACPTSEVAHHFDIGTLPRHIARAVWKGTDLAVEQERGTPTGFEELDANLPGAGWPTCTLTEILLPQPALCEFRLLMPCLAQIASKGERVILVGPAKRPNAPGLAQIGLPAEQMVWIAADTPAERLWTTEQLVKANPGGAILAWLPQARSEQLRRLQAHAQGCDAPIFIFRPEAALRETSPAPLRVLASVGDDWDLHIRIPKRKGGPLEETLVLKSVPGLLAKLVTPRLQRPSQLRRTKPDLKMAASGPTPVQRVRVVQ